MAADWNIQRKEMKKCEAVPGSRIRNQIPQLAQLKKKKK